MHKTYRVPECQMLIAFTRLIKIGGEEVYSEDTFNNDEGEEIEFNYVMSAEDCKCIDIVEPENVKIYEQPENFKNTKGYILTSIKGRTTNFSSEISIDICNRYMVDLDFIESDIFLKIFDFTLIRFREDNFSKESIVFSIDDIAKFLGIGLSTYLKKCIDKALAFLENIYVTFIKSMDEEKQYSNFIRGGIITTSINKSGTYMIIFSEEFHKLMKRNFKRFVQIPQELYSSDEISKHRDAFYYR